jgi:hypothetical protein
MAQSSVFASEPLQKNCQNVSNEILLALPEKERTRLLAKMQFLPSPAQSILIESGSPIDSAYFVESGLCSFLNSWKPTKPLKSVFAVVKASSARPRW